MAQKQILAPSVPALTLAQVKSHLRIISGAEDELLLGLIQSAIALLETETALALVTQGWRLWLDDIPTTGIVELPRNPVQRITNVVWYDQTGTPNVLGGNTYFLNAVTRPARLRFDRSALPSGLCNGIEIDFDAGFGDLGIDIPDIVATGTFGVDRPLVRI
ncbi:MAG: phage head-tail connector protein [Ahrensia sp.]|nr:phage head-tail connector protein [Ahrensia sp.]